MNREPDPQSTYKMEMHCVYCRSVYSLKDAHGVTGKGHGICPMCYERATVDWQSKKKEMRSIYE